MSRCPPAALSCPARRPWRPRERLAALLGRLLAAFRRPPSTRWPAGLEHLDERMLRDIGIDPAQVDGTRRVERIVATGRF